jgi:hypothetical protein
LNNTNQAERMQMILCPQWAIIKIIAENDFNLEMKRKKGTALAGRE